MARTAVFNSTVRDAAASIARALQGRRSNNHWLCRCPVPGHGRGKGDRNPSLSIRDGDERLLVRCFAGCDARDVLDELRRRGLLSNERSCASVALQPRTRAAPHTEPPHEPDQSAIALWRSGEPTAGSKVESYFARDIGVPPPPSLRSISDYSERGTSFPAMVAAVQAPDGQVVAAQVTLLDPCGTRKAGFRFLEGQSAALGSVRCALASLAAISDLPRGSRTPLEPCSSAACRPGRASVPAACTTSRCRTP